MIDLLQIRAAVKQAVGDDDRPIVVFSSAWPFMRAMRQSDEGVVDRLLDVILDTAAGRMVLMPSFASGYVNGECDLDTTPSTTGALSERFRVRAGAHRTLSAFFSFSVHGPDAAEVMNLMPTRAWGEGSVYEWMEQRNVCFLMFGTDPTHCSYLHRAEWLARDVVHYRFDKTFSGTLIRGGQRYPVSETLFVRRRDPPVINDFTVLAPALEHAGLNRQRLDGVSLASYHAQPAITQVVALLRRDPCFTVKNRKDSEPCQK